MIGTIDHVVITTAHLEACISFYRRLGFRAVDAGGRWELFAGDFKINVHIQGHELAPKAACVQPGSADLCFALEASIAACQAHLLKQGIAVELGPVSRYGVHGAMTSLYLRDPDGNLIELCHYP